MAKKTIQPSETAENIKNAWASYLVEKMGRTPAKRPYIYASSYWDCKRRMVLDMTKGDMVKPFPPEVLAKFRRGNDRARDLLADLSHVGRSCEPEFQTVGQEERFEIKSGDQVIMVGKTDCRLDFGREYGIKPPLECKSWAPQLTARLDTFADCFKNKWTKKGAYQLLAYLYGAGEEIGFLLLDKSGLPELLPVELNDENLDHLEKFLADAEAAMEHKDAGTLPDYHDDPEECRMCDHFGVSCQPPLKYEGAEVILDEELLQSIERRDELATMASEYLILDRDIKKRLRGCEQAVAGDFLITGKWGNQTGYDLPDNVKTTIEKLKQPYKTVNPMGRFTLKISKLVDDA
jgi:hypothetical protein